jgi:dimethylglycine dehydrogenase
MLSPNGRLLGDFTVAKLGDEHYFLFGSGAAQQVHMRWFLQQLPETGVALRNRYSELVGIAIAGPRSRDLLSRLTRSDVSAENFQFLDVRGMEIGGVPAMVGRISFTGELGYEIYCTGDYQLALYEAILAAGSDLDARPFGARALMSLRLEKGFGVWTLDFRPDFTAAESGLDAYVAFDKPADFIGKGAALEERAVGPTRKRITLKVEAGDADASGDEPVLWDGACVGFVTSGGYGHYTRTSLAIGYVDIRRAPAKTELQVEILGEWRSASVLGEPTHDPSGDRLRS